MIKPGHKVIVDKDTPDEFEAIVYMMGIKKAAICDLDGDREIVDVSRLTLKL